MRTLVRRHETAAYVLLTFALSWPLWFASGVLDASWRRAPDMRWMTAQLGVFAPAFAGLILAPWLGASSLRRSLQTLALVYVPAIGLGFALATRGSPAFARVGAPWSMLAGVLAVWACLYFARARNRAAAWPGAPAGARTVAVWTFCAAAVPVALYGVAWILAARGAGGPTVGTVAVSPDEVRRLGPGAIAAALAFNLPFGGSLGEEPGWRGFWLPRLLRSERPLGACLIVSFVWALWHAPIDFTQGFGLPGIGGLVARQLWTLPVTVLFTWVTLRAGGSLLPPLAFHTTLNAVPDFALVDPARYARATWFFFILMVIASVVVTLRDRALRGDVISTAATSGD